MEGDPKFEASQDAARLPLRPLRRAARPARASASTTRTQVGPAWDEALAADRPVVLEAITDPEVPPLPPHITLEQAKALTSALADGRPERRADHQAVVQAEARRVPARPMTHGRRASTAPGRAARRSPPTRSRPTRPRPTARSSGTRRRSSSSQAHAGGERGLGYTYADAATATLIDAQARRRRRGRRRAGPAGARGRRWSSASATSAAPGSSSMAIAAVDIALWDLKARLLDLPLVHPARRGARPRCRLRQRRLHLLFATSVCAEQLAGWVERGIPRVKMKVGRRPERRPERVRAAREAIGAEAELFVDANGAYSRKQALWLAERFAARRGVSWFEEPVSSDDLEGLRLLRDRAPAGMEIAAGEYGYDAAVLRADARRRRRRRAAGRRHPLRRDHRLLRGRRALPGASACRSRCTAGPRSTPIPAVALDRLVHLEYFHDHARIEAMLFDGVARSRATARCAPTSRGPGNGLELKRAPTPSAMRAMSDRTDAGAARATAPRRAARAVAAQTSARHGRAQRMLCRRDGRERAAARRRDLRRALRRARSATSGCGRRSSLTPAAGGGRGRRRLLRAGGAHRAAGALGAVLRSTASSACHCTCSGVARKPGGFARGLLQPRHGAAAARARVAGDGRRRSGLRRPR